ncbi:hypothetical protein C3L33_09747, partial [Rhododendron williamsianum]
FVNIELPMDKLCLGSLEPEESPENIPRHCALVIFVLMLKSVHRHLVIWVLISLLVLEYKQPNLTLFLCLELARDALHSEGFFVIGGYMSPVNDAYRKRVRNICRDFGVVCIRREGQDIEKLISNDEILNEYKSNIKVVDELVPNQISSTRGLHFARVSIKYLTADEVIDYITKHHLYVNSTI